MTQRQLGEGSDGDGDVPKEATATSTWSSSRQVVFRGTKPRAYVHVLLGDSRRADQTFTCKLFTGPDLNMPWVAGKVSGRLVVRIKA